MNAERMAILERALQRTCGRAWVVDIHAGTVHTQKGLASSMGMDGYVRVATRWEGKYTMFGVHEVIAHAAGLDILDKEVNHINGIKTDNRIENLEAVTRSGNIKHAFRTGLNIPNRGEKHGRAVLTSVKVKEIREKLKAGTRGLGKQLAAEYGVHTSTISAINKGRLWNYE